MPSTPIDIADVVTRVLRDEGLVYADMAEAAGVSEKQVGRWSKGENIPPRRKIVRALEALGIDPQEYGLRPTKPASEGDLATLLDRLGVDASGETAHEKLDRILEILEHRR